MARTKQTSRKSSTRYPLATKGKRIVRVNKEARRFKYQKEAVSSDGEIQCEAATAWTYISAPAGDESAFIEGITGRMNGLPNTAGKWRLFNNETELCPSDVSHNDYAWQVAKSLVKDFKNTGIISAKYSSGSIDNTYGSSSEGVVYCYTANYEDKLGAKRGADAIRKAYPYHSCMYYNKEADSNSSCLYKHTVDNQMYERDSCDSNCWVAIDFDGEAPVNETLMPSRVKCHKWLYTSSLSATDGKFKVGVSCDIENLPENAGKWLLFQEASVVCPILGMSHQDNAWQVLRSLVADTCDNGIITVKCSTNRKTGYSQDKGVICCYTADHSDRVEVKKAADAIRKAYPYLGDMFYKTERDSDDGVYRRHGDRAVTIYKHTPENKLFERDVKGGWTVMDV